MDVITHFKNGKSIEDIAMFYSVSETKIKEILIRAELYFPVKTKRNKEGKEPISKNAIVAMLECRLDTNLKGLEKCPKQTLLNLYEVITGEKIYGN